MGGRGGGGEGGTAPTGSRAGDKTNTVALLKLILSLDDYLRYRSMINILTNINQVRAVLKRASSHSSVATLRLGLEIPMEGLQVNLCERNFVCNLF